MSLPKIFCAPTNTICMYKNTVYTPFLINTQLERGEISLYHMGRNRLLRIYSETTTRTPLLRCPKLPTVLDELHTTAGLV